MTKKNRGNTRNYPKKISCERCGSTVNLTYHHPLKRCVFGWNDKVIVLCKRCHNGEKGKRKRSRAKNIEELIKEMEMRILVKYKDEYLELNRRFLRREI